MAKRSGVSPRVSYSDHGNDDTQEQGLGFNEQTQQLSVGISDCRIIRDEFGIYKDSETKEGQVVHRYTLLNKEVTVQVMTYGATILAVTMPDKTGVIDDVVLGFDTYEEYRASRNPYFGATIGRVTGIIPHSQVSIENENYFFSNNFMGIHHANGGYIGLDKVLWNSYVANDKLYLTYMCEDNQEGFPGDVLVTRCYELTESNELIIETTAKCTKPTPIDITTHIDWNLAGQSVGAQELYKHYLIVNADKYAQLDKDYIMTGKLKKVSRTVMDFRISRLIGRLIHKVPGGGYDHYMSLTRGSRKSVSFAAKLIHPGSGRYVEVLCDQPGLLIYTQNNLYAHKNVVRGHPISCWVNDPRFLLEQQMEENVYEMDLHELEAEQEENAYEFPAGEQLEEEGMEGGGDAFQEKLKYTPLVGKLNVEYLRHSGIRLVPMNYPEPVAKRRNYEGYIINPGETYLNTTIFKFGTKYASPINLGDIIVPDSIVDPEDIPEQISTE